MYTRVLPKGMQQDVLVRVFETCSHEPNLSYRKWSEIDQWYRNGNILFALCGDEPVGWLVGILHGTAIELAAGYIAEGWRSKGIFQALVRTSLDEYDGSAVVATFNVRLAELLMERFRFERCSLWSLCRLTRGRFIWSRLHPKRIFAIGKHLEERKPIYLVRHP